MKVELQCGDTIAIPEDCKATIKNGEVVIEQKFKDGDFIINREDGFMAIFKEKGAGGFLYDHAFLNFGEDVTISNSPCDCSLEDFQPATEEEKQLMHDALKKQGLRWNADKKRVEKIRWRAKYNEEYYSVSTLVKQATLREYDDCTGNERWNAFNYFRTEEQAKEAAKRVKETLRKYHEEIGE